jgi:hypothetical protein
VSRLAACLDPIGSAPDSGVITARANHFSIESSDQFGGAASMLGGGRGTADGAGRLRRATGVALARSRSTMASMIDLPVSALAVVTPAPP